MHARGDAPTDYLRRMQVVVLKQQDIIDLEAESFNPLRERGLSKGYVKDSALGEAYVKRASRGGD